MDKLVCKCGEKGLKIISMNLMDSFIGVVYVCNFCKRNIHANYSIKSTATFLENKYEGTKYFEGNEIFDEFIPVFEIREEEKK